MNSVGAVASAVQRFSGSITPDNSKRESVDLDYALTYINRVKVRGGFAYRDTWLTVPDSLPDQTSDLQYIPLDSS